jgi:hypothetical protein
MDTLALLCNLYGDGPQTLRRLREAGCGTLAALETLESERLASLLRTSVRSAKRFQAEGRLLRERSEGSAERTPARRPSAEAVQPSPPKDVLVESVLSAWRERDARAGDHPPALAVAHAVEVPRAPLPASREGLEGLDGMDAALLSRLRESGIESLAALREADVLDLAGRRVAGFTRLLHLQFLARRTPEGRTPCGGTLMSAVGGLVPALSDAGPCVEAGAARRAQELPTEPGTPAEAREPRVATASAAGAASPETEGRHAIAGTDDVLVPARAQERRGGLCQAVQPPVTPAPRFSPRSEPPAASALPLEAELERLAAARRTDEPLVSGTPAHDDAGSSGPFA